MPAAQHLADGRRVPLHGALLGFECERTRAFAEQAAVARHVERSNCIGGEQSAPVVVQHHLRLDQRVVADRDRTVRLAHPQRFRGLDHRERAAAAVVRDAGVRTLEAVLDPQMT